MVYGVTKRDTNIPTLRRAGGVVNRWGHSVDLAAIPFDLAPRTAHRAPRTAHLNESETLVAESNSVGDAMRIARQFDNLEAMMQECLALIRNRRAARQEPEPSSAQALQAAS